VPDDSLVQAYAYEGLKKGEVTAEHPSPLRLSRILRSRAFIQILLCRSRPLRCFSAWHSRVRFPAAICSRRPWMSCKGIVELIEKGLLLKYIVASLFRVSWGFMLAVLVGVPLGLVLGWFRPAFQALNPMIQILRPISPIAWIPVAILWFGINDTAPVFLIFLASVFPITVSAMAAVQNMQLVYCARRRTSA
jgi:ABC-type nitrate/sulfonate/bicarbonate transport system permease component